LGELLTRYRDQVSPTKRSAHTEKARINAMVRRPITLPWRIVAVLIARPFFRTTLTR